MSDGYRSILSLTFELMRLLFSTFYVKTALDAINTTAGTIALPGVVAIDEIDAIFIRRGSNASATGSSTTFRKHSSS